MESEKGLPSYPKVYNLGHRAIRDLFLGPVVVQEKDVGLVKTEVVNADL